MTCPTTHKHAETFTCYTGHRCRCDDCVSSWNDYQAWLRHVHAEGRAHTLQTPVDATGTRRRLQALAVAGWPPALIAKLLNTTPVRVRMWARVDQVRPWTAMRVRALFDELDPLDPPQFTQAQKSAVSQVRAHAAAKGWAASHEWVDIDTDPAPTPRDERLVDHVAVDLALEGHRPRLTIAERWIVVSELTGRGWSSEEIGAHLGCSSRTIQRDREAQGIEAAYIPPSQRTAA